MTSRHGTPLRRGFTLVEASLAMLLLSVLLVAGMRASTAAVVAQRTAMLRAQASLLADGMVDEIMSKRYADPDQTPVFGRESGEGTARSTWDDVDDYHGLNETVIGAPDGTPVPGASGLSRRVSVDFVQPTAPGITAAGETGVKRVSVTVRHGTATYAVRTVYRTAAPE